MLSSLLVMGLFVLLSLTCAVFFYCQSLCSGLPRKRWAIAGLILGPLVWPLFAMDKRMRINKSYGINGKGLALVFFRA